MANMESPKKQPEKAEPKTDAKLDQLQVPGGAAKAETGPAKMNNEGTGGKGGSGGSGEGASDRDSIRKANLDAAFEKTQEKADRGAEKMSGGANGAETGGSDARAKLEQQQQKDTGGASAEKMSGGIEPPPRMKENKEQKSEPG